MFLSAKESADGKYMSFNLDLEIDRFTWLFDGDLWNFITNLLQNLWQDITTGP